MKKLIASFSALILIAFIFSSCSESLNTETPSSAPSAVPGGKGTFSPNLMCVNNDFPLYSEGSSYIMSFRYCSNSNEIQVTAQKGAILWHYYADDPNYDLEFAACGASETETSPLSAPNLIALQEGNYPKLSWNFLYTHHFIIERKIGTGSWATIRTLGNQGVGSENYPYTTSNITPVFVDSSINLNNYHDDIYYRIKSQIFSTFSNTSAEIKYNKRAFPIPTGFSVSPGEHGNLSQQVTVSWTPSTDLNVTGYEIYRASDLSTNFTLVTTINSRTVGSWINSGLNWTPISPKLWRSYEYKIRAINASLNLYSDFTTVGRSIYRSNM